MNRTVTLIILLGILFLLPACGAFDTGSLPVGNGEVESFVEDVSADLGIGPTQTPTPSEDATPTPTRTPQPTLIPTFTPDPDGPILTGAGPATSNDGPLQLVEVTLSGEVYVVVDGDTLSEIAESFDVSLDELYSANLDLITDRDLIEVGWELQIPE